MCYVALLFICVPSPRTPQGLLGVCDMSQWSSSSIAVQSSRCLDSQPSAICVSHDQCVMSPTHMKESWHAYKRGRSCVCMIAMVVVVQVVALHNMHTPYTIQHIPCIAAPQHHQHAVLYTYVGDPTQCLVYKFVKFENVYETAYGTCSKVIPHTCGVI